MAHAELAYELLSKDLSAPRVLLDQVVNYISEQFGFPTAELPRFFKEKFPTLEDFEVDLAFSPQYTPAEHNRLEYIPVLGSKHFSPSELGLLKSRLNDAGLTTVLKTQDGLAEVEVPVHAMFIDRYVDRLKLDQKIPSALYDDILAYVPEESHNEANLLARDDVWQAENRQTILSAFLRVFNARHTFSTVKLSFLTNFIRTYRPGHLGDLDRQLDSLIESCKSDMENVPGRGFHDEYLKAMNVDNSLTKGAEREIWDHYKHMMDMSEQLKDDYQHIAEIAPELLTQASGQPA